MRRNKSERKQPISNKLYEFALLFFTTVPIHTPRAQIRYERIFFLANQRWKITSGNSLDVYSMILRAFYKIRFHVPMNRQKIQCWKISLANKSFALRENSIFHEAVIFFATANLLSREIFQ